MLLLQTELVMRARSAEASLASATERGASLASALAEAEGRARGLEGRLQALGDAHEHATKDLAQVGEARGQAGAARWSQAKAREELMP